MSGRAVEFSYAAAWRLVRALPPGAAWAIFRASADGAAWRGGPAVERLSANLRRVIGPDASDAELALLVRDGLRSYARYWLQAFRLPALSREQILAGFRFERAQLLADAVAAGTGCVVALPHSGNWDHAGAWVCARGWPLTTVAERLRPEGLFQRFVAYREQLGMEIIPAAGTGRAPLDLLAERLSQCRVVPLVADRDLSARGIEVQFFGSSTRMPAGPALLALRTGAPLLTARLWYEGSVGCARIEDPIPLPPAGPLDSRVRQLTQAMADRFADGIAAHPADWHMLQRLWHDVPGLGEPAAALEPEPSP